LLPPALVDISGCCCCYKAGEKENRKNEGKNPRTNLRHLWLLHLLLQKLELLLLLHLLLYLLLH
jgi:hypothetical protein